MERNWLYYREQAERCRRLASQITDREATANLHKFAEELDAEAARLLRAERDQADNLPEELASNEGTPPD